MQHAMLASATSRPAGVSAMHGYALGLGKQRRAVGASAGIRGIRGDLLGSRPAAIRVVAATAQQQRQAQGGSGQAQPVPVSFSLKRKVKFGQSLVLVGDHPALGSWRVGDARQMGWNDGHVWRAEVVLDPGTTVEFKCVRVGGEEGEEWEDGHNHVLQVPASGVARLDVTVDWGAELAVAAQQQSSLAGGLPAFAHAPEGKGASREDAQSGAESEGEGASSDGGGWTSATSSVDERLPSDQWRGQQTRFMQRNEHSHERRGVWNTAGLEGPLLTLVEGDRDHGSWLGKLSVVKRLIVDSSPRLRPELDTLASVYVYMQWIATGAVQCVEGGGHQRPNRHAELSRLMFRSLEWAIEDAAKEVAKSGSRTAATIGLVARRLHTRLPSFTEQFTQSTPLTRIRDIAHRNDIPKDLKAEIKHTIQNKLHRNAGPEDLVATEEMLARITRSPGEFSEPFVEEFKKFVVELRDFFNAGSLSDALLGIQSGMDDASWQLVERFLAAKAKLDSAGPEAAQNLVMDALHGVTSVRALLAAALNSGLRNDAPDKAMAMRQRYRLCEVRTEDYAFVLLSRFINILEEKGGAGALAHGTDGAWALPIGALVLGMRHVGLAGFDLGECMAVERELTAWQQAGGLTTHDNALRLRATLQRMQRLCEGYSQLLMDAYTERSKKLGAALGMDPQLVSIFPEGEVRASMVFQLSKLCSLLLRATGMVADVGEWEVIVGGDAQGVLIESDSLEPGCLSAAKGKDAVVVVREASGDEEVAALGPTLKGVILRHAIPHLSHLGVRARQERVPFVCCEDDQLLNSLAGPLVGKQVRLHAGVDGATLTSGSGAPNVSSLSNNGAGAASNSVAAPHPTAIQKVLGTMRALPLEDATSATCGAKAAACGELLRLAKHCEEALGARKEGGGSAAGEGSPAAGNGGSGGALFRAPHGLALPFGCMEVALRAENRMTEYEVLVARLEWASGAGHEEELDKCCQQLEQLIKGLRVPQQVLQQISGAFKPGCTVIARSSANVEDLAGMSGAGLYESVPNIDSNDHRGLEEGICAVWASLHTRRAALSRHAAGVPQSSACMAVVVQAMLAPDLSFVLHTAHPLSRDPATLAAELAPGMGETLAAGTRGSGWRLEVDKGSGAVTTRAFANFSRALLPDRAPGNGVSRSGPASEAASGPVQLQLIDYSDQPMSASEDVRGMVGRRLTAVGRLLEHEFGGPQDVEGCFSGGEVYVVQTRPQP